MAALTANRSTIKLPPEGVIPDLSYVPVAASTKIYQGAQVALDANGRLIPATSATTGQVCIGKSEELRDNSSGAAGAMSCTVRHGAFKWLNSGGGDAIAQANVGQDCYAVDDQTVALTDGQLTRARAGKIFQVDTDGVWVVQGFFARDVGNNVGQSAQAGSVISFYIPLANITAADIVAKFKPGFAGRIVGFQAIVSTAATTAAKLATLTPQINVAGGADAAVTGGALALTSANCTPVGAKIASAAITGANSFGAGDSISILGSAVTAFVEGAVMLLISLA